MGRSNLKQEFVCHWQKDFNSIPDDLREDDEIQPELHRRLDVRKLLVIKRKEKSHLCKRIHLHLCTGIVRAPVGHY